VDVDFAVGHHLICCHGNYGDTLGDVVALLEQSREAVARSVNALTTATYWQIGRRIVESEQAGENRAAYGHAFLQRLTADFTKRLRRGFGVDNLELMRLIFQNSLPTLFPNQ
jgi:hypothetical protein